MLYILEDWLKEKSNMEAVHGILNKYLYSDIKFNGDNSFDLAVEELKSIGETIIIEKLNDGTLSID